MLHNWRVPNFPRHQTCLSGWTVVNVTVNQAQKPGVGCGLSRLYPGVRGGLDVFDRCPTRENLNSFICKMSALFAEFYFISFFIFYCFKFFFAHARNC